MRVSKLTRVPSSSALWRIQMRAGWRWTCPRNDSLREYTIFTGRPVCSASRHEWMCRLTSSARAERAADAAEGQPHQLLGEPEALGHLLAVVVQPLGGDDEVDAAVVGGDGEARLGAHERLVLHPDLVGALDDDGTARVGIAAADDQLAEHVAVGVQRWRVRARRRDR